MGVDDLSLQIICLVMRYHPGVVVRRYREGSQASSNISLDVCQPQPPANPDKFNFVPVSLHAELTYHDIISLFEYSCLWVEVNGQICSTCDKARNQQVCL